MARETQKATQPEAESDADAARAGGLSPGLHLLATPIGAAMDLTLRGLQALRAADVLACEDTRVLRKLMDLHGVSLGGRPMVAYHEHNAETARPKILAHLEAGRSVLLASDAGTPLIADPGYKLVRAVREAGHALTALPGPCAAITALVLSGLPTDAFSFIGFPPPKSAARRRFFEAWTDAPGSLILYESPRRLAETLADLEAVFGADREAVIARELTKRFEEVRGGALGEVAAQAASAEPPRGEIVVLLGPPARSAPSEEAIDALLRERLQVESVKDAVRTVVERLGAGKKMVYERALAVKGESSHSS